MSSSGSDEGGCCGCLIVIVIVVAGYLIMNTDNPVRDAARKKAFDMGVEHVKSKLSGK
jgi:hypothetical protein